MMRYLQRQRRSVISSTGFKRLFGLLLGAIIFLASAIPLHIEDNLLTMPEAVPWRHWKVVTLGWRK